VAPAQRHPRTAAGVSRDGRTLLLAVADGRQPGWSVGLTLPELARLMIEAGAWNAVNLDGGGSSAMWYREPGSGAGRVLNRPSDGRVRPVASHLGVRVHADDVVPAPK
jgi:exopolysaccharide biosynthesis protein